MVLTTRVLILISNGGGGHISLAQATKDALEKYYHGQFQVKIADLFPKWWSDLYNLSTVNFQSFQKRIYYEPVSKLTLV